MVVTLGGCLLLQEAWLPLVVETTAALERLARWPPRAQADAAPMLIIVNPYATTVSDRLKHLVVYALQGRYDVEAIDTQRPGHATELCREAADEGYDVVVAFGGDGTINEAANGLAGSDTPLTCLPGGATNVYSRMLGIPNDVVDATEHLLRIADDWRRALGRPRRGQRPRASPSPPAPGSTPASSSASTATRGSRPATARCSTPRPRSASSCALRRPARRSSRPRSTARSSRASAPSCRTATPTRTSGAARSSSSRARSSTRATSGGVLPRAQPGRHPDRPFRALS